MMQEAAPDERPIHSFGGHPSSAGEERVQMPGAQPVGSKLSVLRDLEAKKDA